MITMNPQPVPPSNISSKSFLKAWVLALFFGALGIDSFYAGLRSLGFVQLGAFVGMDLLLISQLLAINDGRDKTAFIIVFIIVLYVAINIISALLRSFGISKFGPIPEIYNDGQGLELRGVHQYRLMARIATLVIMFAVCGGALYWAFNH